MGIRSLKELLHTKSYFTQNVKASITAEILRVKAHIAEAAATWKIDQSDDTLADIIQLEVTLNCLLDTIEEITNTSLSPESKTTIILQQLKSFEEHLDTLDQVMQGQTDSYLVKFEGATEAFDDYDSFVRRVEELRQANPTGKIKTVFPRSAQEDCLLTTIGACSTGVTRVLTSVTVMSNFNKPLTLPACIVDTGSPYGIVLHPDHEEI